MGNKVTFGLEQVHVAFMGVAQAESIEILTGCTTDGEITVTVTGAPLGGAVPCVVPLSTESHSTVANVASAICNVLNNHAAIGAAYAATNQGGVVTVTATTVAADDATLALGVAPASTGVTAGASTSVTAGTTGWGAPIPVPGAVKFSPSPQGKEESFYADNMLYYTSTSNDGYTADLEMAAIPDAVLKDMFGWKQDQNGVLVEIADGTPKQFALLAQVQGDAKNRRFVYYCCKASRGKKDHNTKGESVKPDTDTITLTITPITIGTDKVVRGVMELNDTNTAAFSAFFGAVYTPSY